MALTELIGSAIHVVLHQQKPRHRKTTQGPIGAPKLDLSIHVVCAVRPMDFLNQLILLIIGVPFGYPPLASIGGGVVASISMDHM